MVDFLMDQYSDGKYSATLQNSGIVINQEQVTANATLTGSGVKHVLILRQVGKGGSVEAFIQRVDGGVYGFKSCEISRIK